MLEEVNNMLSSDSHHDTQMCLVTVLARDFCVEIALMEPVAELKSDFLNKLHYYSTNKTDLSDSMNLSGYQRTCSTMYYS